MVRFTLLLLFLSCHIHAQKIDEGFLNKAKELNKEYKETQVAALSSSSVYDFFIDKKSKSLYASHEENLRFLALRSNADFIKRNYYNDKSFIESYSLKSDRGKSFGHDKFCGHYQSGEIFYSDAQVCAYKFYMSLQGQVVDFNAKTIFTDPRYLTKIFFHDDIPVEEREVIIKVPNWADIELIEMNFDGFDITKTVSKGEVTVYTFKLTKAKVLKEEANDPGYLHYLPHILVLTKAYTHESNKINVLASTEDLYSWYHTLTSQLGGNNDLISAKVKEITEGLTSETERIEAIYYWVQDNIRYVAFENGLAAFKPEEAEKVFYNRYGDCKGMANLTKTMLQIAGIDARLTWIGTNKIPYTYNIPSLAVDNHMICTAYAQGQQYILDPTEKYNQLGHHAERIQGKQILIENGTSFTIDTVRAESIDEYLQENRWTFKIAEDQLTGSGYSEINGEYKKTLFNYFESLKGEDIDKFFKTIVSGNSDPENFQIEKYSKPDRNTPFTISYLMKLENQMNKFEDEIYLDLDFEKEYKGVILKDDRIVPYHFGKKVFNRTVAQMPVPKGYTVNYLPEAYYFESDYFRFNMKYEVVSGKIIYTKDIKILKNTLPVSAFEQWNTMVNGVTKFYNDQIILKADD